MGGKIFSSELDEFSFTEPLILLSDGYKKTVKYIFALASEILTLNYEWIDFCIEKNEVLLPIPYEFVLPRGLVNEEVIMNDDKGFMPVPPKKVERRIFFGTQITIHSCSDSFYRQWKMLIDFTGAKVVNELNPDSWITLVEKEENIQQRTLEFAKKLGQAIVVPCYIIECLVKKKFVKHDYWNTIVYPKKPPKKNPLQPKKRGQDEDVEMADDEEEEQVPPKHQLNKWRNSVVFSFKAPENLQIEWKGVHHKILNGKKFFRKFEKNNMVFRVNDCVEFRTFTKNFHIGVITSLYEEWNGKKKFSFKIFCPPKEILRDRISRDNELFLISYEDVELVANITSHIDIYNYICDDSVGYFCVKEYNPSEKSFHDIDNLWNLPKYKVNSIFWMQKRGEEYQKRYHFNSVSINGKQFFLEQYIKIKAVFDNKLSTLVGKIEEFWENKFGGGKFMQFKLCKYTEQRRELTFVNQSKAIQMEFIHEISSLLIVKNPFAEFLNENEEYYSMKFDEGGDKDGMVDI